MHDTIHLRLSDEENTMSSGKSLSRTLHQIPVDLLLTGEMGTGKTTLVRGLASGMGITDPIVSPTFALEQRYRTAIPLLDMIHIDCYRLQPTHASKLLHATDDHTGIRCIEWADRTESQTASHCIRIKLAEENGGRSMDIAFDDVALPTDAQIDTWRAEVRLPSHIVAHCEQVATVAERCAHHLLRQGTVIRPRLLKQAAKLHDLLRFVDMPRRCPHTEEARIWNEIRAQYAEQSHEAACATWVRERGYSAVAQVVETHGIRLLSANRPTIEQEVLYYADKRTAEQRIVSIEERVNDFVKRYGTASAIFANTWGAHARVIEQRLFPDGPPV